MISIDSSESVQSSMYSCNRMLIMDSSPTSDNFESPHLMDFREQVAPKESYEEKVGSKALEGNNPSRRIGGFHNERVVPFPPMVQPTPGYDVRQDASRYRDSVIKLKAKLPILSSDLPKLAPVESIQGGSTERRLEHSDPEVSCAVQVLDKLIALAKQCGEAAKSSSCEPDSMKPDYRSLDQSESLFPSFFNYRFYSASVSSGDREESQNTKGSDSPSMDIPEIQPFQESYQLSETRADSGPLVQAESQTCPSPFSSTYSLDSAASTSTEGPLDQSRTTLKEPYSRNVSITEIRQFERYPPSKNEADSGSQDSMEKSLHDMDQEIHVPRDVDLPEIESFKLYDAGLRTGFVASMEAHSGSDLDQIDNSNDLLPFHFTNKVSPASVSSSEDADMEQSNNAPDTLELALVKPQSFQKSHSDSNHTSWKPWIPEADGRTPDQTELQFEVIPSRFTSRGRDSTFPLEQLAQTNVQASSSSAVDPSEIQPFHESPPHWVPCIDSSSAPPSVSGSFRSGKFKGDPQVLAQLSKSIERLALDRSKRTVFFADEFYDDDDIVPSVSSWDVDERHDLVEGSRMLSRHPMGQVVSYTGSSRGSSTSPEGSSHGFSCSGRLLSWSGRILLAFRAHSKGKSARGDDIECHVDARSFAGSARRDAQQIKGILKGSRSGIGNKLTVADILKEDFG